MTDKTRVRNVLETARKAGFVRVHSGGANGTTQMNHGNDNILIIAFEEGVFVSARGYGWGDAPWVDTPWNTDDCETFTHNIAG